MDRRGFISAFLALPLAVRFRPPVPKTVHFGGIEWMRPMLDQSVGRTMRDQTGHAMVVVYADSDSVVFSKQIPADYELVGERHELFEDALPRRKA